MTKPLLILDLDETVVHTREERLGHPPDFTVGAYFVYTRPHLGGFLAACANWYDLAVWSSAEEWYVDQIVTKIMPHGATPVFVWGRERCTPRMDPYTMDWYFLKNAKKVKRRGFDLRRVLILEDEPRKVRCNYGNAIYVDPFRGNPYDGELRLLGDYLGTIHTVTNFRRLEKRFWRSQQLVRCAAARQLCTFVTSPVADE